MNKDEQIKALAELDGFEWYSFWYQDQDESHPRKAGKGKNKGDFNELSKTGSYDDELPPYLTSRDSIIPVIEKMPTENRMEFINILEDIAYTKEFGNYWDVQFAIITATPQQLAEALLRATSKWKE